MTMSKLDSEQIARTTFDEATGSTKVLLQPVDIIIEGDSTIIVQSSGIVSCKGFKTACLYGTGTVSVSPADDGTGMQALSMTALTPITICARTIQIVGTGTLVIQTV